MKIPSNVYKLIFIGVLLIFLTGCIGNTKSGLVVVTQVKSPTSSLPTLTHTDYPPTSTDTPIPTDTPVITETPVTPPTRTPSPTSPKTPTDTPTETLTHTPEPATLIINQDTVCMTGASFGHSILFYISAGSEYRILGKLQDQSWWLVNGEDQESCWLFGSYASVRGALDDLPVITPPPLPSLTPTPPPTTAGIYYILISENTGGPFGCGDNLIRFYPGVWVKGDMEDDIVGALNALFSNHNKYTNGLYNPIYQSQLKAKSVEVRGNDVVVQLGGTFVRPKDSCESQRMHDQIWYTVSQFSSTRAVIYLNNALLGDLMVVSGK